MPCFSIVTLAASVAVAACVPLERVPTCGLGEPHAIGFDELAVRGPIYSAAYVIPPPRLGAERKHHNHLRLLELMMSDGLPDRLRAAGGLDDGRVHVAADVLLSGLRIVIGMMLVAPLGEIALG